MKLYMIKRNRWLVKLFILVPFVVVVLLNVHLINQVKEFNTQQILIKDNVLIETSDNHIILKQIRNFSAATAFRINTTNTKNTFLRDYIHKTNINPRIRNKHFIDELLKLNEDNFDMVEQNDKMKSLKKVYKSTKFLVILIQVHSRLNYLKELIQSLKETQHIQDTLVVFSHDIFDKEMNDLINGIDFCATLQIFYPFSLQLYPDTFPGQEPNDCPKSIGKKKAIIEKCNNAYHPDSFGNFREQTVVQIKHHWFWKLGYTFEQLNETRNLNNLQVLLLEEDYFLFPDAIHVLRKLSEKILSDIDVVSLALFDKLKQNLVMKNFNKYSKAIWHTSSHNTGLMIGRAQWKMIKDCLNAFCTYDDYNWDWSLQHISQFCFKLPLVSIHPDLSRVIHIGECGTHHKGKNCDPKEKIKNLNELYEKNKKDFFPKQFDLNKINTLIRAAKKSNGGWSDPRDHALCRSFASPISNRNNLTIFL